MILYQKILQKDRGYFPKLSGFDLYTLHKPRAQGFQTNGYPLDAIFNILTIIPRPNPRTENDGQNRGDHDTARNTQGDLQGTHTLGGCCCIISRHDAEHGGVQLASRDQGDDAGHHVYGNGGLGHAGHDLGKSRAHESAQHIGDQLTAQEMASQQVNAAGQNSAQGGHGQATGMNEKQNGESEGTDSGGNELDDNR